MSTFVYDDQSTDGTAEIAREVGCQVVVRPDDVPSFLEHEGHFRQAAWGAFEQTMRPKAGSWLLIVDADECLVTVGSGCVRCEVNQAIQAAEAAGHLSVLVPVPEIFGMQDGVPLVRTDGLWPTVAGTILCKYIPNAVYRDKPMGCGREPVAVTTNFSRQAFGLHLLHFGYARERDQIEKHARYTALSDHGHHDGHVQSIVGTKTLKRWDGPVPEMLRGDERAAA
jgi:hypothetical protein